MMNIVLISDNEVIETVERVAREAERTKHVQLKSDIEARIIKEALYYFLNDFRYKE